jgi:hypothetical protein
MKKDGRAGEEEDWIVTRVEKNLRTVFFNECNIYKSMKLSLEYHEQKIKREDGFLCYLFILSWRAAVVRVAITRLCMSLTRTC